MGETPRRMAVLQAVLGDLFVGTTAWCCESLVGETPKTL